jgi:hypothetical protein
MGLPFIGTAMMLANLFKDGDDEDDGWVSAREAFERGAADLARSIGGDTLADWVVNGVPGSVFGIDLKGRIGFGDVWFRAENREMSHKEQSVAWLQEIAGATVAIPMNAWSAIDNFDREQYAKGIEKMVPVAVKNFIKPIRYAIEGVTTGKGLPIIGADELSDIAIVSQLIGFTPKEIADKYKDQSNRRNVEERAKDRRTELRGAYIRARENGLSHGEAKTDVGIDEFNSKVLPEVRITGQDLHKAYRQYRNEVKDAENGSQVAKKYQRTVESVLSD